MAHVAPYKKEIVKRIEKELLDSKIIGVLDMRNMPTAQLQKMRTALRGKCVISMSKKTLYKIAIQNIKDKKPGIEKLEKYFDCMPAFVLTSENPFSLYKTLEKKKSSAPAKIGAVATKDITIPAGPTAFPPGPIIGEFGMAGLKAGIEDGKVIIKEDKVIVKRGDVFKPNIASILSKLGIQPMEIGLNLLAVLENGEIIEASVLKVDEKEYLDNITKAHLWAINLGVEIAFPSKELLDILLSKAHNEAKAVAISQCIVSKEVIADLLAKANAQSMALKETANIA